MAGTIHVRGEGGQIIEMDLPLPEHIAERLTKGHLRRVNPDGTPHTVIDPEPAADGDEEPATVPTSRPPVNAQKAQWVGWAVHLGADPETADGMSKADLIEQYGNRDE